MASIENVAVSLPVELIREIDRLEKDRSKFVAEVVRRELDHRRRVELRRSLENPHPEGADLANEGFEVWVSGLPDEGSDTLYNRDAGQPVRWVQGYGWLEEQE